MTGRTHFLIGANAAWLISMNHLHAAPWLIPLAGVAALLPDLDAHESVIKNISVSIGGKKSGLAIKPFVPLQMVFSTLFRHRTWLHSLVAVVVVAVLCVVFLGRFPLEYTAAIVLGYISHLVSDALTKHGIELFLPFKQRFRLLPKALGIKTGGILDMALMLIAALGIAVLVFQVLNIDPRAYLE